MLCKTSDASCKKPACSFHAAVFQPVRPRYGRSLLRCALYREFAQLESFARLPDESTIERFRHRLQEHKLAEQILSVVNKLLTTKGLLLKVGTAVDATLMPAPASTKNKDKARDPKCIRAKKAISGTLV